MKMKKMWAYLVALSMLLCQNVVFTVAVKAEGGAVAPLVYYNFGDETEWTAADDIAQCASESDATNPLTADVGKRVRGFGSTKTRLSFVSYGSAGRALYYDNNNGSIGWRNFMLYVDDGSGNLFNTKRTLYVKLAYWISAADASSTSTSIQLGWSQPWNNVTKPKAYEDVLTSDTGWYTYSGQLSSSSHGDMTSKGPTIQFAAKVAGDYRIKYIALFETQEAADAFDPSVTAVTSNGVSAAIDNIAHTAKFAESVKGNPTLTLQDGVSAQKTSDVDGRSYGLGRRVKYNVTDIAGNVTEWVIDYGDVADDTSILEEREYGNKKFYIYDFSTEQNMATVMASQVAYTGNDNYSKIQYDSLDTKPIASLSDDYGPAMEVSSDGATQYPYVLLNDQIDTSYRFVKLAYGVYKLKLSSAPSSAKEYYGTIGFGDMYQTPYLTASNAAGEVDATVTDTAGNVVDTGAWTTEVVTLSQSADSTSVLDMTTVNAGDANISAESRIAYKYIALFNNLADATAYDPSVVSATFDGTAMTVDNINHTMELALETGVTEGSIKSIEDRINIKTLDDDVVEIYASSEPEVNETTESVTVTQEFEIVGVGEEAVQWTATVSAPIVAPSEDYLFFDFTELPSNTDLKLYGQTNNNYDSYPNDCNIGQVDGYDCAQEIYAANYAYGGPGLFVRAKTNNAFTQFLIYSDQFDMAKTKYARIEFTPESVRNDLGNEGVGRVVARWESTSGNGNVFSYTSGNPAAKNIHTAIVEVSPASGNKILRVGFYNFAPAVTVKSVGLFDTRAEAESFDPSVRSVRIADSRSEVTGKTAKINGITKTATVELEDNVAPSDMPILTAADISSLVLDNAGATTQHDYVHQAATAAVAIDSQEIAENLTSVTSSISYTVTDKTGTAHTWKFMLKSKKNGIVGDDSKKQYCIMDFTDYEATKTMILDGTIKQRGNDGSSVFYPATVSNESSALHAVNNSGRVGLDFDFPNDEVRYRWYLKTLLNYDNDVAAGSNIQIHWTINWGTSGGRTIYENGLDAEEWTTVTQDLGLAATTQALGLYSNTGFDMNFKYIALFGNAADRDAFDPSVVGAKFAKNGVNYVASVDNIAHTITFPTGCGDAEDLDAAVLRLYNNGVDVSAVSRGNAYIESDMANDIVEIVKTYRVTGLDGSVTDWTAKIPIEAATIEVGEGSVTVSFSEQLDMQKLIAIYNVADEVVDVIKPQSNEEVVSFDGYATGEYLVKVFGFKDFTSFEPLIKEKSEIYYKD